MEILRKAHHSPYIVHPGETKMYQDLKQSFWWKRMRVDIAKYVASYGICQKVKAEHQRPVGLLKPLEIPMWKWENITMDFVVALPHSPRGKDAIWVVIDRLEGCPFYSHKDYKFCFRFGSLVCQGSGNVVWCA